MSFKTDIEIAQESTMLPIEQVAAKLGIAPENLEHYGHYKAKVDIHAMKNLPLKSKLVLISGCPDDGELPEELPVRGHVHCPGGDGQRHHHGSGNGRAPQDPGHPLSVLHLLHFLKNLLFGLVGGTEMGKGLLVQSLVDHDSASCKISFSFPLARMSQVCTVDGLAPMAAAISCTEQSS